MRSYHIDIVTPDGLAFSGEIESLLVRTDDGDVEILANHADFVASLGTGKARITVGGEKTLCSLLGRLSYRCLGQSQAHSCYV